MISSDAGLFRRISILALFLGGMALALTGCVHMHGHGPRGLAHGHAYGHDRAPVKHKDKHAKANRGKGHDKHGHDTRAGHK